MGELAPVDESARPEVDRHHARRHVDERHRGGKRRHPARTLGVEDAGRVLDHLETADAGRDQHADLRRIRGDVEARVEDGFACGCHREVHVSGAAPRLLRPEERSRIEALDLAANANREPRGVEVRDRRDAPSSRPEGLPALGHAVADGRDGPHAGDDDPARSRISHGGRALRAHPTLPRVLTPAAPLG